MHEGCGRQWPVTKIPPLESVPGEWLSILNPKRQHTHLVRSVIVVEELCCWDCQSGVHVLDYSWKIMSKSSIFISYKKTRATNFCFRANIKKQTTRPRVHSCRVDKYNWLANKPQCWNTFRIDFGHEGALLQDAHGVCRAPLSPQIDCKGFSRSVNASNVWKPKWNGSVSCKRCLVLELCTSRILFECDLWRECAVTKKFSSGDYKEALILSLICPITRKSIANKAVVFACN